MDPISISVTHGRGISDSSLLTEVKDAREVLENPFHAGLKSLIWECIDNKQLTKDSSFEQVVEKVSRDGRLMRKLAEQGTSFLGSRTIWNARPFLYQLVSGQTGTRGAFDGTRQEAYGGADREPAAAG
jgi:hypothetical protein